MARDGEHFFMCLIQPLEHHFSYHIASTIPVLLNNTCIEEKNNTFSIKEKTNWEKNYKGV
jgi:hypothetical protein